jgi:hypothetical protein
MYFAIRVSIKPDALIRMAEASILNAGPTASFPPAFAQSTSRLFAL